jgi:fatty-acyl-CoA synthase
MKGPRLPALEVGTVAEALARAARHPSVVTLVDGTENEAPAGWDEIYSRARRCAQALCELGIEPGQPVAIVLPTGLDFLDAFFGSILAGAVPVPLYPPTRLSRLDEYVKITASMLKAVQARVLLTDRRMKLLLGHVVESAGPQLDCRLVSRLMKNRAETERPVAPDSLGLIQFSSGTDVDPKPVALTHRALIAQCAALKSLLRQEPGTRELGVSWLPLYHDMGLIGCLLEAAYFPGPLVLLPPEVFLARPALWLKLLSKHRGTISPAPSFAFGLCVKRIRDEELKGIDLSHWTYALNGAEPVSPKVVERFIERFTPWGFRAASMMPVYGLSEAGLAVTFSPRGGLHRIAVDMAVLARERRVVAGKSQIVSVGIPVPGAEVEVRDESGIQVEEGRVGTFWVRAPFMMKEYYRRPEDTKKALQKGWLNTEDFGFLREGAFYICGRGKDSVIIRGVNHAPQEFEQWLDAVPGVRPGCAVAVGFIAEDTGEESLLLLVETTPEASEGLSERLRVLVLAQTSVKPHTIRLLPAGTLPRTSSGKLRRGEALRRYLDDSLNPPQPVRPLKLGAAIAKSALAYRRHRK